MIDIDAKAAPSGPGFKRQFVQIGNVMGADDVETLLSNPGLVNGILFGSELLCKFLRYYDALRQACPLFQGSSGNY